MGRAAHKRTLGLWMNGDPIGIWTIHPNGADTLQYDDRWVRSARGRPLSLSLPFMPGNAAHKGAAVQAYFENLLPDTKEIRERVARRYNAKGIDAFSLLAEIGRDCAGALQILPKGMAPEDPAVLKYQVLTDQQVASLLRDTVAPAAIHADGDLRISIAGAQEKTALLFHEGRWCRPLGSTPTTHILKLPLGLVGNARLNLGESVENEWLCSLILKEYGLPVAHCEMVQFEDVKALAVARFDRQPSSRSGQPLLYRLPQEDFCQATATPPDLKYEANGGPGMADILKILEGSAESGADRRTFFQAQLIFWMLRACDGHAKNFSLAIGAGGSYRLTPLYDILSFWPILGNGPNKVSPYKAKLAMAVRGKNPHYKISEILPRHWREAGERFGIVSAEGRPAQHIIDDLAQRTPAVIRAVKSQLPAGFPQQLAGSVLDGLQAAAGQLAAG
jgi:serine/threonine-protein kinase HipA